MLIGVPQPRAQHLDEAQPRARIAFQERQDIATLEEIELERPSDRRTDLAGGAKAARDLGLNRLAERLETAESLSDL